MTLVMIALFGSLLIGIAALMARDYARERAQFTTRLSLIRSLVPDAAGKGRQADSWLRRIGNVLAGSSVVGATEVGKLKQTLYAAGFFGEAALERFIGIKIALAGLLMLLGLVGPGILGFEPDLLISVLLVLGGAVIGLRGPDMVLNSRASSRRELMDKGLSDALDLLVVCAEAGIGLELALERVSVELKQVHPVLARELAVTVSEMRLLPDRLQALHNMGVRVKLDSVRAIASTLSQTLKYGTPLGKALRTLSTDFRLVRQTKMEERAARLPVLITIPMILFILPATALVVAGPAFIQLLTALSNMSK